jgi:uncharacterized protein (DUF305 family)
MFSFLVIADQSRRIAHSSLDRQSWRGEEPTTQPDVRRVGSPRSRMSLHERGVASTDWPPGGNSGGHRELNHPGPCWFRLHPAIQADGGDMAHQQTHDSAHSQAHIRADGRAASPTHGRPYLMLALNMVLSAIAMYLAMFAMIDGWGDFRNNLNTFYMTALMVGPMGIIMLLMMSGMYPNRGLNIVLVVGFTVLALTGLVATRMQAAIGDRQFIASMVPHHSGAILMCREADLTDSQLRDLCARITEGQRSEIEEMNAIDSRLAGRP